MATSANAKKGSAGGWFLFLATLLLLSFAALPGFEKYSTFADEALIAIRLSLVLALSILVVRERFSAPGGVYSKKSLPGRRATLVL